MNIGEKIRLLRKTENLTQEAFSNLLNCGHTSVRGYEYGKRKPNHDFMKKLCQQFPEYTLWLMTGKTSGDQIDPFIKQEKSDKTA